MRIISFAMLKQSLKVGSGCGSVGRAVASTPEVHGLNPAIGKIYIQHLFTVLKRRKYRKRGFGWPIF